VAAVGGSSRDRICAYPIVDSTVSLRGLSRAAGHLRYHLAPKCLVLYAFGGGG